MDVPAIVWALLGVLLGGLAGAALMSRILRPRAEEHRAQAQAEAQRLLETANSKSREIVLQAQSEALQFRNEVEAELKNGRQTLHKQEEPNLQQ